MAEIGRPNSDGAISFTTRPSASRISLTTLGAISTPPLAMAAPTRAICIGLACTSCCPMAEVATNDFAPSNSLAGGMLPSAKGSSNGTFWSNPNLWACSTSLAPPSFRPISPNTTLHEI